MRVHVLGSGAGGGFPQWNCHCTYCAGVRAGTLRTKPRTQSSITVSADGERWVLINASPDIRAQIASFAPLRPGRAVRDTGIAAVLLVDAQIDHATGLLMLREGPRLALYTTAAVHQDLSTGFPVIPMLEHYCGVDWHPVAPDGTPFEMAEAPGLRFHAFALSSKAPPYSPHRHDPHPGDNIGLLITDPATGPSKTYHVQVAGIPDATALQRMQEGVDHDGERLSVSRVQILRTGERNAWLEIELDEGRNRQIRRILSALDLEVLRLVRVAIGSLTLGDLAKGAWRDLTEAEIAALRGE